MRVVTELHDLKYSIGSYCQIWTRFCLYSANLKDVRVSRDWRKRTWETLATECTAEEADKVIRKFENLRRAHRVMSTA